jgi:hypothetical protein
MRPKKKSSSTKDYPLFAFRLSEEAKKRLMTQVNEVTNLLNSKVKEDEYRYRKNDIIVNALEKGLKSLKARA